MRRINVAASRARNQMWVVHSADADRFLDDDLRGALIRHCREAGSASAAATDLLDACESQFERDVVQRIVAQGYRKVSVQHWVGRFRIDIVIDGPDARLAVECDGDRWHGPDVWHRDRSRQQVLERANWTFERIRGSAFYRDPDVALAPLWERLAELGIPKGAWSADTAQPILREVRGLGCEPAPDEAVGSSDDVDRAHTPEQATTPQPSEATTAQAQSAPWAPRQGSADGSGSAMPTPIASDG
jgi:very-short-patch-repair endonuclease